MSRIARITVLADNCVQGRGLLGEHGLAFWIETGGRCLLFDTGQGAVLSHNAQNLGVPLERADAIVLSHGHYDHTGGLAEGLRAAPQASLYAHPAAFEPKYLRYDDGIGHDIGVPALYRNVARAPSREFIRTEQLTEVFPGAFVTGVIPRRTGYEDTGGPFFTDRECRHADPLLDDQALFFDTPRGIVVLLGCAHAGVVNTLQYIGEVTNGRPIRAVMGGMHLVTASRARMDRTIEEFRQRDIEHLGPAHCTGPAATAELWNAFPGRCFPCTVRTRVDFELS
jgi:7,8-dihydropterin-6-yl-methyl-4-(beta-D-ribofuranosyl)aminobenzene 5'-phosphate synthase